VSVHLQPLGKPPERESAFAAEVPTSIAITYIAPGRYTVRATGCRDVSVELSAEEQKTISMAQ